MDQDSYWELAKHIPNREKHLRYLAEYSINQGVTDIPEPLKDEIQWQELHDFLLPLCKKLLNHLASQIGTSRIK